IYGTLVSSAGVVSHPQGIAISTACGQQTEPFATPGAEGFLVFSMAPRATQLGTYASRISPAGIVLPPDGVVVLAVAYAGNVAQSNDSCLLVWSGSGQPRGSAIRAARLNSRAEVTDPEPSLLSGKDNDETGPAVAFNGANWLVVWEDWRNQGG